MFRELPMPRGRHQRAKMIEVAEGVHVKVPGASSLFPDALYHLDAGADLVEKTTGNVVAQVSDQKQNIYTSQGATGQIEHGPYKSPTGRAVYRFTNGDTHLVRADAPLPQPLTAYAVFRVLSTTLGHALFDSTTAPAPVFLCAYNNTGLFLEAGARLTNPRPFDTDWHVADLVISGGNSVVGFDGIWRVSGQAGVNDLEPLTVGDINTGSLGFYGEMAELAFLPGVDDLSTRDEKVALLKAKWLGG